MHPSATLAARKKVVGLQCQAWLFHKMSSKMAVCTTGFGCGENPKNTHTGHLPMHSKGRPNIIGFYFVKIYTAFANPTKDIFPLTLGKLVFAGTFGCEIPAWENEGPSRRRTKALERGQTWDSDNFHAHLALRHSV